MDLNRRMLLGRAGALVLAAGLPIPSLAAGELLTKAIPSSGEPLPVIGVGTSLLMMLLLPLLPVAVPFLPLMFAGVS